MKTRYNNMQIKPFEHLMENVLNRSISDIMGTDFITTQPSVNIIDNPDNYAIHLAAPGLEKSDFSIKIEKNKLVISAMKEANEISNGAKFTRREYNFASFNRSFSLDDTIDTNAIEASYNNGILTVMLHKKEEAKENGPQFIHID